MKESNKKKVKVENEKRKERQRERGRERERDKDCKRTSSLMSHFVNNCHKGQQNGAQIFKDLNMNFFPYFSFTATSTIQWNNQKKKTYLQREKRKKRNKNFIVYVCIYANDVPFEPEKSQKEFYVLFSFFFSLNNITRYITVITNSIKVFSTLFRAIF